MSIVCSDCNYCFFNPSALTMTFSYKTYGIAIDEDYGDDGIYFYYRIKKLVLPIFITILLHGLILFN